MPLYAKVKGDTTFVTVGTAVSVVNGIASGFTSLDYLKTSKVFAPGDSKFSIFVKALTTSATTRQNITTDVTTTERSHQLCITAEGKLEFYVYFTDNTYVAAVSSNTIEADKYYYYNFYYTGTQYKVDVSEDKQTWTNYITITSAKKIRNVATLGFGRGPWGGEHLRGSIDLNETFIEIDGRAWLGRCMSRVKVRSGLAKYTKVGNPTINNGILSNCSSANHLELNTKFSPGNQSWEVFFKAKCTSLSTKGNIISFNKTNTRNFQLGTLTTGNLNLYLSYDGTTSTQYTSTNTINLDEWYYYRLRFTGIQYILDLSQDRTTWTAYITVDSSTVIYQNTYNSIGYNFPSYPECWLGEIDLNESYIKIGNSYFWRGSDYYQTLSQYKIHQDNFSKYYTIVDGKLTWANPDIKLIKQAGVSQFINTDYIPNTSTVVKACFSFDEVPEVSGSHRYPIVTTPGGHYHNENYPDQFAYHWWHSSESGYASWFYVGMSGGAQTYSLSLYPNHRYKITVSGTSAVNQKIEDLTSGSVLHNFNNVYSFDGSNRHNMRIFGDNSNNSSNHAIHKVEITENGVTLNHFVPVPKGLLIGNFVVPSNGMFDIVTQTFYGNAGTGEFEIGGIPDDYIIEGGKMIWCNPGISLQNDGSTNVIDTGVIPSSDTEFEIKSKLDKGTSARDGCLMGERDGSTWANYYILWNNNYRGVNVELGSLRISSNSNLEYSLGDSFVDTVYKYEDRKFYVNGTQIGVASESMSTPSLSLYLFGLHTSSAGSFDSRTFKGSVYYCTLRESGSLVRHLVPVPKGILIGDKIAPSNCMFDLVTQTFFENQGTGEFTIGGLSGDYIFVGEDVVWCNDSTYLKCNGAQYFDSGFSANQDTKVVIDYTAAGSGTQALYCSRTNASLDTFTMFRPISTSSTRFDYNTSQKTLSLKSVDGTRYLVVADKNKCYIDGDLKHTATYDNFQSDMGMIFGCSGYEGGNLNYWSYHKYHTIHLYDNNKLVRYFIPVTTNMQISGIAIPAPGMWDMVTKKFYGNAGTGSFTYGKDS